MKKRVAKTLYEKKGGKFVPVGKDDIVLPYDVGDWLIRVRRGSRSIRCSKVKLDVDHARLEVLMDEAADALARAISLESEATPRTMPNTPREQRAFEAYKRIAGKESLTLTRKSACEVAQRAVLVLRERLMGQDAPKCPEGCADVYAEVETGS